MTKFCFGSLAADHQRIDSGAHIGPAGQHLRHLRRNRQLDPVSLAQSERRCRGRDPFGDHLHTGQNLWQLSSPRKLGSDVAITAQRARAREHQIAQAAPARP